MRSATRAKLAFGFGLLVTVAACGPRDTAGACEADEDCESGLCYTESDPGYCTAECETEGETAACPDATVCKRIEGSVARCLLVCEDDAECPANSDCNNVPDSGLSACEPVR